MVEGLQALDDKVAAATLKGLANTSTKSLRTHINAYVHFCQKYDLYMFETSPLHLRRYLLHLSETHKSVDSMKNYIAGVKNFYLLMGREPPDTSDYLYKLTVTGLTRIKGHVTKQAAPVTPQLLLDLFPYVQFTDPRELVAWVATVVNFYTLSHKSNYLPDSGKKFDPHQHLTRGNLSKVGGMYFVRTRYAKNIQFKQQELTIPLMVNPDKRVCPVYWLDYMCWEIPVGPSDPAYTVPRGNGKFALSYSQYTAVFRKWLAQAGYPAKKYSTHSLRRGGATWAARTGLPPHIIKMMGAWRSQAYLRYIELTLQDKCDAMFTFTMAM